MRLSSCSLLVAVEDGKQRVGRQDWSQLTLEAFPSADAMTSSVRVFEQDASKHDDGAFTEVTLTTDGAGGVAVAVSKSVQARSWLVRLHLRRGQHLVSLVHSAAASGGASVQHLQPPVDCEERGFFPFGGAGTPPACRAGPIAEFLIPTSSSAHHAAATIAIAAE